MATRTTRTWSEWYRLARATLDLGHAESVEYANLRFVEEQNREALRRSRRADRGRRSVDSG